MSKSLRRGEPYKAKNRRYLQFQYYVSSYLDKFPLIKMTIARFMTYVRMQGSHINRGLRLRHYLDDPDPNRIYWIHPDQIQYCSLQEFNTSLHKGMTLGGDWDRLQLRFEDLDVYVSFKKHFEDAISWENTMFYKNVLDEMRNGRYLWGCRDKMDFDLRCERLDRLFENIKNNGYKTQNELNPGVSVQNDDEISVNVGRNGDLLFTNGAHRLSIVKILKIPRIPIRIVVRHTEWVQFKQEIAKLSGSEFDTKIQSFQGHIDLQELQRLSK